MTITITITRSHEPILTFPPIFVFIIQLVTLKAKGWIVFILLWSRVIFFKFFNPLNACKCIFVFLFVQRVFFLFPFERLRKIRRQVCLQMDFLILVWWAVSLFLAPPLNFICLCLYLYVFVFSSNWIFSVGAFLISCASLKFHPICLH